MEIDYPDKYKKKMIKDTFKSALTPKNVKDLPLIKKNEANNALRSVTMVDAVYKNRRKKTNSYIMDTGELPRLKNTKFSKSVKVAKSLSHVNSNRSVQNELPLLNFHALNKSNRKLSHISQINTERNYSIEKEEEKMKHDPEIMKFLAKLESDPIMTERLHKILNERLIKQEQKDSVRSKIEPSKFNPR